MPALCEHRKPDDGPIQSHGLEEIPSSVQASFTRHAGWRTGEGDAVGVSKLLVVAQLLEDGAGVGVSVADGRFFGALSYNSRHRINTYSGGGEGAECKAVHGGRGNDQDHVETQGELTASSLEACPALGRVAARSEHTLANCWACVNGGMTMMTEATVK